MNQPDFYLSDFSNGQLGPWGSSAGPANCYVSNGVFHSEQWSIDTNHQAGGMDLRLAAFIRSEVFEYYDEAEGWITSDFTNAYGEYRARGTGNFDLYNSQWMPWIQARHSDIPDTWVNWAYTGNPLSLITSFQEGNFTLVPDPDLWTFGLGTLPQYVPFLELEKSMRNITNFHMPFVGPVGATPPTGGFELDYLNLAFVRNGPRRMTWNRFDKGDRVTLSNGNMTASVSSSGFGMVRANRQLFAGRSFTITPSAMSSGMMAGIATMNATLNWQYLGGDNYGWGWWSGGSVWHGANNIATVGSYAVNDVLKFLFDANALYIFKNGVAQNGGNPVVSGLTDKYFAAVSDAGGGSDTMMATLS